MLSRNKASLTRKARGVKLGGPKLKQVQRRGVLTAGQQALVRTLMASARARSSGAGGDELMTLLCCSSVLGLRVPAAMNL